MELRAREEVAQLLVHLHDVLDDRLDRAARLGPPPLLGGQQLLLEGGEVRLAPIVEDGDELGEEVRLVLLVVRRRRVDLAQQRLGRAVGGRVDVRGEDRLEGGSSARTRPSD